MKTKIVTTQAIRETAYDIAEEMTEMLGTEFTVTLVEGMPLGDYYRIEGEITAEQFEEMPDIENEWLFENPTNEWVSKFGKLSDTEYSKTIKDTVFYYNTYLFGGSHYQILVSGEMGGKYDVEEPEDIARISR
jgi:hypothetical protein